MLSHRLQVVQFHDAPTDVIARYAQQNVYSIVCSDHGWTEAMKISTPSSEIEISN